MTSRDHIDDSHLDHLYRIGVDEIDSCSWAGTPGNPWFDVDDGNRFFARLLT
jgi:hypothetical protein